MLDNDKVLAVIPARGGSKRIPRKNLRYFRGQPLLKWSLVAAQMSEYIDRTVVSTEDAEILAVALGLEAEVVNRPNELATDDAANEDVLRHVLTLYPDFNWIILLQPTSPLRTSEDIDKCLLMAKNSPEGTCISYNEDTGKKNGAVYVCHAAWLERGNNFSKPQRAFYLMPGDRSLDIDYPEQLED